MNLERAVGRALMFSAEVDRASVSIESAKVRQAEANKQFSWRISPHTQIGMIGGGDAGQGPSVGGGLELTRDFTCGTRISLRPNITRANRLWTSNARAQISQPLLRGVSRQYNLSRVLAAEYEVRTAIRSYCLSQIRTIERTIQSVYELRQAQDAAQMHRQIINRLEQVVESSLLKQNLGLTNTTDLHQTQLELLRAQDALEQAELNRRLRLDQLRDLLGLSVDADIVIDAPIEWEPELPDAQEAIEIALNQRIEIVQAEDELGEAIRHSRVDRHRLLPDLNLVIDYANCGNGSALVQSCIQDRINTWSVGFSSSTDLGPSSTKAAYEQGLLRVRQATISLGQKQASIAQEVRRCLFSLKRAQKKIVTQQAKVRVAEGKLEQTELRFRHGLGGHLDVVRALRDVQKTQVELQDAIIQHILAGYRLDTATGTLAELTACAT